MIRKTVQLRVIVKDYEKIKAILKQEGFTFSEWMKNKVKEFLKEREQKSEGNN